MRCLRLLTMVLILLPAGCGVCRFIAGTSLTRLRDEKNGRYTLELPLEMEASFSLVTEVVAELKLVNYLEDFAEGYIITMGYDRIFPPSINTTEVAFFFKELGPSTTGLDIVSLNNPLADYVSGNFPFFALQSQRNQFPEFEVPATLPSVMEVVSQALESRRGTVIGQGPDYLVVTGLRVGKEEGIIESPLVFFFREGSPSRVLVAVGTFNPPEAERVLPFLSKAVERILEQND